jgi:hypothetical protein
MKKAFLLSLLTVLFTFSCDKPAIICYHCRIYVIKDYCDHQETYILDDELRCEGWTEADIKAYEVKTTYVLEEKCFYLTQVCKCVKEKIELI